MVDFQIDAQNSFLTSAQDSHLQTVTIPDAAYIKLRRRPPEDEQGNARNMQRILINVLYINNNFVHQVGNQPRLYYDARSTNHQDNSGNYRIWADTETSYSTYRMIEERWIK